MRFAQRVGCRVVFILPVQVTEHPHLIRQLRPGKVAGLSQTVQQSERHGAAEDFGCVLDAVDGIFRTFIRSVLALSPLRGNRGFAVRYHAQQTSF